MISEQFETKGFRKIGCIALFILTLMVTLPTHHVAASPDEVTYYFNGYESGECWNYPGRMTDSSTATHAYSLEDGNTQLLTGNTCPGTYLGTIATVELRVHGAAYLFDENDDIILRPVFSGGDGDDHQVDMPVYDSDLSPTYGRDWSAYVNITSDTNAPSPWTWSAVQALQCDVVHKQVNDLDYMFATKVEIRVTYATLPDHIITATAGFGGSISPSGTVVVSDGASQEFLIIPEPGNSIEDVLVDGISHGAITSHTFTNVTTDHYITAVFDLPAECSDLSSVPLSAIKHAAPPNIMFVLDDSGSMDWEFLTEESDGRFQNYGYVFDNPGDNVYDNSNIVSGDDRKKWKSQWSGYNRLYYDPSVDYEPWPTLNDADPDELLYSHPKDETPTFDLSATYYSYAAGQITVDDLDTEEPGSGFSKSGTWYAIWNHDESYKNHFWECTTESSEHTATWTPRNLPAGDYEVYAWWVSADTYTQPVPYTINHAGEPTTVEKDQSMNGKQWNSLGTYTFAEDSGDVTISYTPIGQVPMCADAVKFVPAGATIIDIKNAHYYVWSAQEGKPYLIVLDGDIKYYEMTTTGSGATEEVASLTLLTESPPDDVKPKTTSGTFRTYAEERQNFANWYSFYRRRELTSTASVANAIVNMQGVNVGLYSINQSLIQPVVKVKVQGENQTAALLDELYYLTIADNTITPLRQGLEAVGRYFDQEDGGETGGIGNSPYDTAEDGGACQQAFAIVMTDGYWNGDPPLNAAIDNADGDNGVPYADTYSDTLADVAMYYYENDLSSGLADQVPTNLTDSATHQHMVTYTVAFGVSGNLDPSSYDLESGPYPTWPDLGDGTDDNKDRIDDLWHAAVNGRGKYLSVFNSGELVDALLAIKQNIESRTGSAASVSVNGVELYEEVGSGLYMFQSTYNSDGWTGDVKAYQVNLTTGEVSETPEWSAANQLDATLWSDRKIATYSGSGGIPFTFDSLTDDQKTYLDEDWQIDDTKAKNILRFLRGDRSLEQLNGGTLRDRFSVLGDVVHSSPVFENGVLYTGGNDGMLHAFRATNGSEIFAYIPNLVFENLINLADPAYYGNHTYYVDLSPVIERGVDLSSGSDITLLVGGLGRGGKGYYALDITGIDETTSFISDGEVAGRFLWEYGNDDDLGYSYARPAIVDSEAGWIVIAGNGYNSVNGNAVLLILNPSNGTVLKRIDTGVGSCNGLSIPIAIDVDYDDKVDYVYAGDLKGNLWKFDLTDEDYTKWGVAYKDGVANPQPLFQALGQPITTKPDVMWHPEKHGYLVVFATGKYLGITDFSDTSLNTIYGIWDYGDDADDSEYLGFFNRGSTSNKLSNQPENVTLLEQKIVESEEQDPNFWTVNGKKLRILTTNEPNWETVDDDDTDELPNPGSSTEATVHAGWYFDLPLTGERVVSDVMIRDGRAIVITFTPEEAPCSIGGDSIIHEMDAASGGRLLSAQFDIDADTMIDSNDLINIGDESNPVWVAPTGLQKTGRLHLPAILRMASTEMKYFSSSEGTIKRVREKPQRLGVRHWRELE